MITLLVDERVQTTLIILLGREKECERGHFMLLFECLVYIPFLYIFGNQFWNTYLRQLRPTSTIKKTN